MMKFFRENGRDDVKIEITPLIDVVFLLLIFFMISTTFITSPGLKVNLPQAGTHELRLEKKAITITIDHRGRIYIKEELFHMDDLKRELMRVYVDNPETSVVLRADEEAFHGHVVTVMDLVKRVGFERLAIATEIERE